MNSSRSGSDAPDTRTGRTSRTGAKGEVSGVPLPRADGQSGYYGLPLLKSPQWTWEIPAYFFVGGAAGAAAMIACAAEASRTETKLGRDSSWIAAAGGVISPLLLTADLGAPSKFLNMLRVFKSQSPMSIGSWTLALFSSASAATVALNTLANRGGTANCSVVFRSLRGAALGVSAATGLILCTYTGVLIGATAVPVWNESIDWLPFHFGASGLGAAVSLLELKGHRSSNALGWLGLGAALAETAVGARIEIESRPAFRPLTCGTSGWLTRLGGVLSGPLPLGLRLLAAMSRSPSRSRKLRCAAAASAVAGSVLTRAAWMKAGEISAQDPRIPLGLQP